MVEIECPHCDEIVELDDDDFGQYECPHCEEEFEWAEAMISHGAILVGDLEGGGGSELSEADLENLLALEYWKQFKIGLGLSTFLVLPLMMSIEGFYYGPEFSDFGLIICWLWPITGVSTALIGFVIGNKGLGVGALVGCALSPLLFFFGCFVVAS
mgnify:FL=1